jgi:hypothetical protein
MVGSDLGGGFASGEQPVVIPVVAFIGGGAQAPLVLVESVAEDDVEGGETAGQERERQADAEEDQDGEHGDEGDAVLQDAAKVLEESDGAVSDQKQEAE